MYGEVNDDEVANDSTAARCAAFERTPDMTPEAASTAAEEV